MNIFKYFYTKNGTWLSPMLNKIVGVSVGLLVAGLLIPIGLVAVAGGNYTGVDPTVKTVATVLLPVLAVIGLALYFMPRIGKS